MPRLHEACRRRSLAAALCVLLAASCGGGTGPPREAGEAALRLFELAEQADDEGEAALLQVFDATLLEEDRVGALEAVASLRGVSRPAVVAEVPLIGGDRVAVDVVAAIPGGSARYGIQAERQADGTWRVVAIQGPGRDWPSRPSKAPGLSVSPPADER